VDVQKSPPPLEKAGIRVVSTGFSDGDGPFASHARDRTNTEQKSCEPYEHGQFVLQNTTH